MSSTVFPCDKSAVSCSRFLQFTRRGVGVGGCVWGWWLCFLAIWVSFSGLGVKRQGYTTRRQRDAAHAHVHEHSDSFAHSSAQTGVLPLPACLPNCQLLKGTAPASFPCLCRSCCPSSCAWHLPASGWDLFAGVATAATAAATATLLPLQLLARTGFNRVPQPASSQTGVLLERARAALCSCWACFRADVAGTCWLWVWPLYSFSCAGATAAATAMLLLVLLLRLAQTHFDR